MTDPITVQVIIPADLKRVLDADVRKAMRTATFGVAEQWVNRVKKYPGKSEANAPDHQWYVRGWGVRWHSQKGRRWGDYNPPRPTKRAVSYHGSWAGVKTSEKLNRSWATKRFGLGAIAGSRASYAPAVHHHAEQMKKHKERGWKTDKEAADEMVQKGLVDRIVRRKLRALGFKP